MPRLAGARSPGMLHERAAVKTAAPNRGRSAAVDDRSTQLEQTVPMAGLLGYLNFSDGRPDPRWQKQLNDAFAWLDQPGSSAPWSEILGALAASLERLHSAGSSAFRDV